MYKLITLLLLLTGCATIPPTSRDVLLKTYKGSVRVLTPDGGAHGSGFYTRTPAGNTVVVTNAHVCEGLTTLLLLPKTLDNLTIPAFPASPTLADPEKDLCAIKLPSVLQAIIALLPIAKAPQQFYDRVFILGYPALSEMSVQEGLVLSEKEVEVAGRDNGHCKGRTVFTFFGFLCLQKFDLMLTSTPTIGGNSGSPALNDKGEVVGVFNSGDSNTNYGNYVKLEDLKNFLKQVDEHESK